MKGKRVRGIADYRMEPSRLTPSQSEIVRIICIRVGIHPQIVLEDMSSYRFWGRGRFTVCEVYPKMNSVRAGYGVCMYLPEEKVPYNATIGQAHAFSKAVREFVSQYKTEKVTTRRSAQSPSPWTDKVISESL